MTGGPGHRSGRSDPREAARGAFADHGYDAAVIRRIAGAAGVDAAVVHHYFGTAHKLFSAAANAPVEPGDVLASVIDGDRAEIGQRLVRAFLTVWDGPAGSAGVALLRSAMGNRWAGKLFHEFVVTQILGKVQSGLGLDPADARLRISLVASQMVGLAMVRYVLRVEPLASAPADLLIVTVGPVVQHYLTGDLSPDG
jgi:AcrR family transcriptional regulator